MRTVHVGEKFFVSLLSISPYCWIGPKNLPDSIAEVDQAVQLRPNSAGLDQHFGFDAKKPGVVTMTFSYISPPDGVTCYTHDVDIQIK